MKRSILAIVLVLCMTTAALATNEPYGWSISASSVDPMANSAAPTFALATYSLWLVCTDLDPALEQGMAAAEFDVVSTGPQHVATIPMNGFLNAGGTSNLLLAVGGCPSGPVIAMNLLALSFPGSICLAASATNGIKGTVDCEPNPSLWGIDWVGLNIVGGVAPACSKGDLCAKPVSVEDTSWGKLKSLYR